MLTEERHAYIIKQLKENGVIKSQEIVRRLNCSESTIRRDLILLEKAGYLKRIHGGAKQSYNLDKEQSILEKSVKNVQEKTVIGKYAASLVHKNDFIYIDAGTTTYEMIPFLQKDVTVATNGVQHASLLADYQIQSFLIGGMIKHTTKAIVGATSVNELKKYRFNKAFIGINGIDNEYGYTTPDPEEATMKQLAIEQSAKAFILADHTKWGKVNFAKVCDIDEVTLVTDKLTKSQNRKELENATILEAMSS
ncbi:DeoR/GlpR family DNA-binding transcription regulator [Bacillus andreraoultii]|uniref:DeoR/GlpR family DNA-binding transcription regulator n=1 Tax=Bacillus andreraoultii TaxID=1499685 RepID=UPI00053A0E02|nr:DeoR/GlpR family DNA-binding transcription regulator [Bacillus andreraoultii]